MSQKHLDDLRSKIKRVFKEMSKQHRIDCDLKEENSSVGYLMSYDPNTNTIFFDPTFISKNFSAAGFKTDFPNLTLRNFVAILLSHELGHYEDYKENPHLFSVNSSEGVKRELNAWGKGRKYLSDELEKDYSKLKDISLKHYQRDEKL
ncbi:hypothetical protein L8C07_06250 [Paenibacillus sp. CMAA1739]|uniref:hypothetical protein n=1 Tax=Paenibacillus ottowii TaxID=2315729 RepID=UPI002DBDFA16|nr:hypothetical protein [Paenibacillus sp. CMAA1739]MEC4565542.1 hypothetical protein [Paenibacillus sp. CMAA1739]